MFLRSGREDTNFAYVSAGWKATVTTGTIERHSLGNEKGVGLTEKIRANYLSCVKTIPGTGYRARYISWWRLEHVLQRTF